MKPRLWSDIYPLPPWIAKLSAEFKANPRKREEWLLNQGDIDNTTEIVTFLVEESMRTGEETGGRVLVFRTLGEAYFQRDEFEHSVGRVVSRERFRYEHSLKFRSRKAKSKIRAIIRRLFLLKQPRLAAFI